MATTRFLTVAAVFVVAVANPARGQDTVNEQLLACSDIADTAERAACFDGVVNNMRQAGETPMPAAETPVSNTAPAESVAPAAVTAGEEAGSDTPVMQIEEQAAAVEEEEFVEFNATILQSKKSGLYHFVVELDNGQVWEETDGSRRPSLPKVGQNVRVYEGRLGGYRMKIGNDNRISWVRRLR